MIASARAVSEKAGISVVLIPKSIDKSARLEMPTHVKRSAEDKLEATAAKKARLDGGQVSLSSFQSNFYL